MPPITTTLLLPSNEKCRHYLPLSKEFRQVWGYLSGVLNELFFFCYTDYIPPVATLVVDPIIPRCYRQFHDNAHDGRTMVGVEYHQQQHRPTTIDDTTTTGHHIDQPQYPCPWPGNATTSTTTSTLTSPAFAELHGVDAASTIMFNEPYVNESPSPSSLWDPWGVFFIYLSYEIGISNHKGMNLGWMNLGWNFIYLFLSIKRDDISRHVFHMFAGCEFTAKNGWILRHVFHMFAGVWISDKEWKNFELCFSSVYGVWISDKEWKNLKACFSYVYGGVNFWWILRYVFHMFMGCEFLT